MKERQWIETGSNCCKVRGFVICLFVYLFIILKFCHRLYEERDTLKQIWNCRLFWNCPPSRV